MESDKAFGGVLRKSSESVVSGEELGGKSDARRLSRHGSGIARTAPVHQPDCLCIRAAVRAGRRHDVVSTRSA